MSDLGSEELEEEGENDLGVRALGEGGASRGARRREDPRRPGSPSREIWRPITVPPGDPVGTKTTPATAGVASWKLVVKGETL